MAFQFQYFLIYSFVIKQLVAPVHSPNCQNLTQTDMQMSYFRPTQPFPDSFFSQTSKENHNLQQNPTTNNQSHLSQKSTHNQNIVQSQFTLLNSSPENTSLLEYYNTFKSQIDYLFIIQQPRKLLEVVRICKILQMESTYFISKSPPHIFMAQNQEQMIMWASILHSSVGSHVEGVTIANVSLEFEKVITRGIAQKMFTALKNLIFSSNIIANLEFMSFINAPGLEMFQIYDSQITLLGPLAKTNNSRLNQIMVSKSYVNDHSKLSRMRLNNTSSSKMLGMCFWTMKSCQQKMNEINSLAFMYKLQGNDAVESISKCLQIYNSQLRSQAKQVLRVTGRQRNMKPQIMRVHELQFCKKFKPRKYKELLKVQKALREGPQG